MECKYCHRVFSKGEHLRRHERALWDHLTDRQEDTGVRPFVCKECKRPFARQDALARHEKLHTRKEYSQCPSPPASQGSRQSVPSPAFTAPLYVGTDTATQHSYEYSSPADQIGEGEVLNGPLSADMDFDLIWPDSEQLLENLISLDPTTQWQGSLGRLPISAGSYNVEGVGSVGESNLRDKTLSIGNIPAGESHKAVHNVSEMVTKLSSTITAAVEATSLTSVFLDECLHMFFVRFIPTFPILHRSTFVFRDCTQPLLLNAMAIGSLYLGPKDSIAKGEALWRLAHMAVATSWETLITHRGLYDPCPGVQLVVTSLLGQVYGALSRNRAIRTTSQAFHALSFFWAQKCSVPEGEMYSHPSIPSLEASELEKDNCWRAWVAREIRLRAVLGHYLLDGLVSQMSDGIPSVRHTTNRLHPPSVEPVFEARTADEWISSSRAHEPTQHSFRSIVHSLFRPPGRGHGLQHHLSSAFAFRVTLEGLQSLVSDSESDDFPVPGVPNKMELRQALAQVNDSITSCLALSSSEKLETLLRWHMICLDACINSSILCQSICTRSDILQYVYPVQGTVDLKIDLISWVHTEDARRALLHALAIQEIVEQLPRGRAHAIHIPSSLFAAATVYCVFLLGGRRSVNTPHTVDWQTALSTDFEFSITPGQPDSIARSATKRYMRGEYSSQYGKLGTNQNLLYELNSMQKLFRCLCSQWGIAYDMADIIDKWHALCH